MSMKKINITLNQDYKSFKNRFRQKLEGDLIILSGVNGSGKSQLMNIIYGFQNDSVINRNILLDGAEMKESILYRSFRDNITLGELGNQDINYKQSSKEQAWNAWQSCRLGNESDRVWRLNPNCKQQYLQQKLYRYETSLKIAREKVNKLNANNPQWANDSQNNRKTFFNVLPDDFIWQADDILTADIGNLFLQFANKRVNEQINHSKTGGFDNLSFIQNAPWTKLNKLFEKLKLNYRFKEDYEYDSPKLKEEPTLFVYENGHLKEDQTRRIADLSDGEKAIINLAISSFDNGGKYKIALFDEYDATLNPSLIEAFFTVLKDFYLDNGTQVILTTHSPATISLAPKNATFYELFHQEGNSPSIRPAQRNDYAEMQIAHKNFYDKIKNQESRLKELEEENSNLQSIKQQQKPILFVEDTYTQIYKVAWLKLNDIEFTEQNIDEIFESNAGFVIYGKGNKDNLRGFLHNPSMEEWNDKKIVGLFDFDDAYACYKALKTTDSHNEPKWDAEQGSETTGLYKKRTTYEVYALMLPIPEFRNTIAKTTFGKSYLEVELLFKDDDIKGLFNSGGCSEQEIAGNVKFPKINNKADFWKKTTSLNKDKFQAFQPLFDTLNQIFKLNNLSSNP